MKRVPSLTVTLLKNWLRSREAVFFAFVLPIVFLVVFSVVFAGGAAEFDIAVQNNDLDEGGDPTELSAALVNGLEAADALNVHRIDPDRDLSEVDRLEAETGYQRVVVIPEGFAQRTRRQSGRVRVAVMRDTIQRSRGTMTDPQREDARNGMDALEDAQGATASEESVPVRVLIAPDDDGSNAVLSIVDSVVARFNERAIGVRNPPVTVDAEERGAEGLSGADYFLPAFIVAMILFNTLVTVPAEVATFKRDGTLRRLAATPLRRWEWVLANLFQQSILSVVIVAVMLVVAWVLFDVTAVPGPLAVGLIVIGTVAFGSLGMIFGSLVREPGSATSLGVGVALPLMFISGVFWELDLLPATLQEVAAFSPVTHYHRSLRELMVLHSMDGIWTTVTMLVVMAVVFVPLAVLLTDWSDFE